MAEAQKKTVQFPGQPQVKELPTVTMHPLAPLIDKVAVPAAWFVGGIVFAKLFLAAKREPVRILKEGL